MVKEELFEVLPTAVSKQKLGVSFLSVSASRRVPSRGMCCDVREPMRSWLDNAGEHGESKTPADRGSCRMGGRSSGVLTHESQQIGSARFCVLAHGSSDLFWHPFSSRSCPRLYRDGAVVSFFVCVSISMGRPRLALTGSNLDRSFLRQPARSDRMDPAEIYYTVYYEMVEAD